MTSEKADTRRYSTMTTVQAVAQCAEFGASIAMANGINANVVHRWRKLARGGHEDRRVHRIASDDGSIAGIAHHIEVGWCGLACRTALRRDHDAHHLTEQSYRRIRSLDSQRPQVNRWP